MTSCDTWLFLNYDFRAAYTEMGVLLDVLNIAKEKKYMFLDHVQLESAEPKSAIHLMAKKKVLIHS